MAIHDILQVTTELKFRPGYMCSVCGRTAYGDIVTAKFQANMNVTPQELLKGWPLTVRHAPVGWSSYPGGKYGDTFKCPKCTS